MNRNELLKKLQEYSPSAPEERVFKDQMITFINEHPNCFDRSLEIGHITASCWLLNKDGSRALLMHHAKLDKWFQLGGHCDGESNVPMVALKEAREESGINGIELKSHDIFDIDIHLIPANKKEKAHYHYDVRFLLQVMSDEQIVRSSESKDLAWISKDLASLPTNNPSVVRMFEKWLQS